MLKNVANPWQGMANGPMPISMLALQKMLDSNDTVTQHDCGTVTGMADQYLQRAVAPASTFAGSEFARR